MKVYEKEVERGTANAVKREGKSLPCGSTKPLYLTFESL